MFCSLRGVAGYADRPMSGGHAPRPTRPAIPPDSPFSQADGVRQAGIPAARGLGAAGSARGARVLRGGTRGLPAVLSSSGYEVRRTRYARPGGGTDGRREQRGSERGERGVRLLEKRPSAGAFFKESDPLGRRTSLIRPTQPAVANPPTRARPLES